MPLVCPMEGTLPTHPSSDGEDTDLVDINTGAAATCGCGEPDADALASLAAAALGLNDLWPLLLPGALVPATTFNTARPRPRPSSAHPFAAPVSTRIA